MNKKIKIIILALIGLILISTLRYNNKLKTEKGNEERAIIEEELMELHLSLKDIVRYIEDYEDCYRDNKYEIRALLRIPVKFENILDKHTLTKLINVEKLIENYKSGRKLHSIRSLIQVYYDMFMESVSSIDNIDF